MARPSNNVLLRLAHARRDGRGEWIEFGGMGVHLAISTLRGAFSKLSRSSQTLPRPSPRLRQAGAMHCSVVGRSAQCRPRGPQRELRSGARARPGLQLALALDWPAPRDTIYRVYELDGACACQSRGWHVRSTSSPLGSLQGRRAWTGTGRVPRAPGGCPWGVPEAAAAQGLRATEPGRCRKKDRVRTCGMLRWRRVQSRRWRSRTSGGCRG